MFLKTPNKRISLLIILIPLLVLVEQQRTPPGLWTTDEFIDENLLSYTGKTKNCAAFVLDQPNAGYWLDISHAIALTLFIDTPTVNGYSGSRPANYPSFSWYSDGDLPAIGRWLTFNDKLENVCMLDGTNFESIAQFDDDTFKVVLGQGFTGVETLESDYWTWSVWEKSSMYIQSFKELDKLGVLKFTIQTPKCLENANFKISIRNDLYETVISASNSTTLEIPITIIAWERIPIIFEKDPGFCNVNGDPRDLHFSVKNLQIEEIK